MMPVKYDTASVCIPPSYVKQAAEYVGGRVPICTVIGFPNGYETTAVKEFETKDAIANGADEIDMVINIGWLKDRKYDQIEEEIRILKNACGSKVLKVIIETCLLTDEEKFHDFYNAARSESVCPKLQKLFRVFHRGNAARRFHLHVTADMIRKQADIVKSRACF